MSKTLLALALLFVSVGYAFAQDTVPARWRGRQAVCPSNYNYVDRIDRCVSIYSEYGGYRDYGGYRGEGVPAHLNRFGQPACPSNYDYIERLGACYPHRG